MSIYQFVSMKIAGLRARDGGADCRISSRFGWAVLGGCILLQFLSFFQMVQRDIVGIYPFSFDQTSYLRHAYESFESMRAGGFSAGLKQAFLTPGKPNGTLLQGEAAFAYLFFGAGRATSLVLVFFHFAALQVAIFAFFRRLTGRSEGGLISVGLLLLSTSRFYAAGGLNDFRLDLSAACLYGICLCILLASDLFQDLRLSLLLMVFMAALFATRFIAITYALGAMGLLFTYFLFEYLRLKRESTVSKSRAVRALVVIVGSVLMAAPFLWVNLKDLFNYYFIGHFMSDESSVRAAEFGVSGMASMLLFYPKSLIFDHLGRSFLIAAAALFSIGLIQRATVPRTKPSGSDLPQVFPPFRFMLVTAVWIAVPLLLYTLDKSKSPIVAIALVAPVAILITFVYLVMRVDSGRNSISIVGNVIPLGVLFAGTLFTISKQAERVPRLEAAKSVKELYNAYDDIADDIRKCGLKSATIATDRMVEYINGAMLNVMIYERTGEFVDTRELIAGGVMPVSREIALDAVARADYAVLTLNHPVNQRPTLYPFDQNMFDYRSDLLSRAATSMIGMRKIQVGEHLFQVFAKPHVEVLGISGGWVPSAGLRVKVQPHLLERMGHILLSGPTIQSYELKDGLKCSAFVISSSDGARVALPTKTFLGNDQYAIAVDTSAATYSKNEPVEVEFEFSSYFVPKERGINEDTRKLVVSAPKSATLVIGTAGYPPGLMRSLPNVPAVAR